MRVSPRERVPGQKYLLHTPDARVVWVILTPGGRGTVYLLPAHGLLALGAWEYADWAATMRAMNAWKTARDAEPPGFTRRLIAGRTEAVAD